MRTAGSLLLLCGLVARNVFKVIQAVFYSTMMGLYFGTRAFMIIQPIR